MTEGLTYFDGFKLGLRRQQNLPRHDQKVFGHIAERHFSRTWVSMRAGFGLQDDTQFVVHPLRHTCCARLVSAGTDFRIAIRVLHLRNNSENGPVAAGRTLFAKYFERIGNFCGKIAALRRRKQARGVVALRVLV